MVDFSYWPPDCPGRAIKLVKIFRAKRSDSTDAINQAGALLAWVALLLIYNSSPFYHVCGLDNIHGAKVYNL